VDVVSKRGDLDVESDAVEAEVVEEGDDLVRVSANTAYLFGGSGSGGEGLVTNAKKLVRALAWSGVSVNA